MLTHKLILGAGICGTGKGAALIQGTWEFSKWPSEHREKGFLKRRH